MRRMKIAASLLILCTTSGCDPLNIQRAAQILGDAQARADTPVAQFCTYLGDYLHMMAVGKDFYGIFSMSNVPNPANFPTVQLRYQRNANFTQKRLLSLDNLTPVTPSIDPFFFKVEE